MLLERAERSLETARGLINELQSEFCLPPITDLLKLTRQTEESSGDETKTPRSRISAPLNQQEGVKPLSPRKRSRVDDGHPQEPQAKRKIYRS